MRKEKNMVNSKIAIFLISIIFLGITNVKLFAADEVDCVDSDGDGIPDVIEIALGTDPEKFDTTPIEFAELTADYYTNSKMNMKRELAKNVIRAIAKKLNLFGDLSEDVAEALTEHENPDHNMFTKDKNGNIVPFNHGSGDYGITAIVTKWWANVEVKVDSKNEKFKYSAEEIQNDTYTI